MTDPITAIMSESRGKTGEIEELKQRIADLETAYHFSRQPGNGSVGRARLLEAEERIAERVEHNK